MAAGEHAVRLSEDGSQRRLWFTAPPGSDALSQLELLTVIGTQDLNVTAPAEPVVP